MTQLSLIIQSMRPKQWVKNVLLLAGLYFPDQLNGGPLLFNARALAQAFGGFAVFCALSGAIYLVNDIVDAPRDRLHPRKKDRPIAARKLSAGLASAAALLAGVGGLGFAFWISYPFGLCTVAYAGMMIAYSFILKEVFLIDTLVISMGFILRAVSGIIVLRSAEQNVLLTPWFVICVLFLSLLLAFCKRRAELSTLNADAVSHRPVLAQYSQALLDTGISVCATATILAYALYAVEHPQPWRMLSTLPFVIYGVFRYIHLVYHMGRGDAPEEVFLGDISLLGCVLLWGFALALVFYPA